MLIEDLGADVLVCTPSYALHIVIRMAVELVAPGSIERSAGKATRVVDHRRAPRGAGPGP